MPSGLQRQEARLLLFLSTPPAALLVECILPRFFSYPWGGLFIILVKRLFMEGYRTKNNAHLPMFAVFKPVVTVLGWFQHEVQCDILPEKVDFFKIGKSWNSAIVMGRGWPPAGPIF